MVSVLLLVFIRVFLKDLTSQEKEGNFQSTECAEIYEVNKRRARAHSSTCRQM